MPTPENGSEQELRTAVVEDWRSFELLAAEWDALLGQSGSCAYFLRHAWNLSWWRHCAPNGARLHIITCRDRTGRLLGVAPTYGRKVPLLGVTCIYELTFIGMGIDLKTSEYLDVIAAQGHEHTVAEAMARQLASNDGWDRLWLQQVPAESPVLPHLLAAFRGQPVAVVHCDRAPFIDTSGTWESYKRTLGRSMRRNVEYYPRRLRKSHKVDLRLAATPAEIDIAIDHLVRLHQALWTSRREAGAFSHPSFEQLVREMANEGLGTGNTRLWTLALEGEVQAALLGFLEAGVLHYFQKGFNPAFASHELGNVMVALCVRACCEDPGVRAFDFMGGGAPYKELWGRNIRNTVSVEVRRANARMALYEAFRRLHGNSVQLLRAVTPMSMREARREYLKRRARMRS